MHLRLNCSLSLIVGRRFPIQLGLRYPTAHHAAIGEVRRFLNLFARELDHDSEKHCRDLFDDWGRAKDAIDRILSVTWCQQFSRVPARIRVERAHLAAKFQIALQPAPIASLRLPEVDVWQNRIHFDNRSYNVSADAALLMQMLLKAYPDWLTASKYFSKPSRIKNSYPGPVKLWIETQSGKGYRLKGPERP